MDTYEFLGRKKLNFDFENDLIKNNIKNRSIMVTGAGGSIGSELVKQLVGYKPKSIILIENSEYSLFNITNIIKDLLVKLNIDIKVVPLLCSVISKKKLVKIMSCYTIDIVYHTAAYKHVSIVEQNIVSGIENNVYGTYSCALAAIEARVKVFILVSTDKAVNPLNFMGASKKLAEIIIKFLSKNKDTRFNIVRLVNIWDSSGSVVSLFKKQIAEEKPIKVTHPDVARYFITVYEAVQMLLQVTTMKTRGDTFILDVGEPMKIIDLADKLIEIYNKKIDVNFIGLKTGEKLLEELYIDKKKLISTKYKNIKVIKDEFIINENIEIILKDLKKACDEFNVKKIEDILKISPINFIYPNKIEDLIWKKMQ